MSTALVLYMESMRDSGSIKAKVQIRAGSNDNKGDINDQIKLNTFTQKNRKWSGGQLENKFLQCSLYMSYKRI